MTWADYGIELPPGAAGEIRALCPQCSHTRKPANQRQKCLAVNADKGTWWCHNCEWTGGLSERRRPYVDNPPKDTHSRTSLPRQTMQQFATQVWARVDRNDHVVAEHPYCRRKTLDHAYGAGRAIVNTKMLGEADCVVIPVREFPSENVVAVQLISEDGAKQSLGPIKGHCLPLGNTLDPSLKRFVVEGWATAAAMLKHYRGNIAVMVAFGSSNLRTVAELAVNHFPGGDIWVAGECDG